MSSARNIGLDNTHGDYITFVDSDDYIAPNMIEFLSENIEAIIVPRKGCCLARLFGGGELVIPWSAIEVVGEDLVLVRFFDIDNKKLS